MKSLKLSFALILLMMISSACGSIKTRKDLKIQGIEIKRDNASSTKTQVQSNPQPTETVVVEKVVEKPVVVATQNEEKAVAQTAPVVVERKSVDPVSMELQMAAEIRRISGELQDLKDVRAEEQRLKQENELKRAEKLQKMEAKLAVYEQSILALEEELRHLKSLKTAKPVQKKGIFERAEDHMAAKAWKKAILEFENYRKKYPKGRRVSLATYYIGVCFQELKLNDEAKAFYQETLDKYPKTAAFRKAKYRLNQLK